MPAPADTEELTTAHTLACGEGWRVEEVVCRAAPELVEQTAGTLKGAKRAEFASVAIPPLETLLPLFSAVRTSGDYEGGRFPALLRPSSFWLMIPGGG